VAPTVDRVGLARLTAEHCLVLTLSGFVSERGVGEQEVVREKGCSDDDDTRTSPATHFPGQGYPPDWDTV
jgi:hypothetical protein